MASRTPSRTASRVLSAATVAYAVYAAVRPEHLARAVGEDDTSGWRALSRTFAARDLAVSGLGVVGSAGAVDTAMRLRIACDVGDCVALLATLEDDGARAKVAATTLGWATLNLVVHLRDRRR